MFKKKKYLCSSALVLSPLLLNDVHAIVASEEERLHYESRYGAEHMENDSVLQKIESEHEALRTTVLNTVKKFFGDTESESIANKIDSISSSLNNISSLVASIVSLGEGFQIEMQTAEEIKELIDSLSSSLKGISVLAVKTTLDSLSSSLDYLSSSLETIKENIETAAEPITKITNNIVDRAPTNEEAVNIQTALPNVESPLEAEKSPLENLKSEADSIASSLEAAAAEDASISIYEIITAGITGNINGIQHLEEHHGSGGKNHVTLNSFLAKLKPWVEKYYNEDQPGVIQTLSSKVAIKYPEWFDINATPASILAPVTNAGADRALPLDPENPGNQDNQDNINEDDSADKISFTLKNYQATYGADPITIALPEAIPSEATITVTVAKDPGTVSYTASSPSTEDNSDKITIDVANKNISIQNLDAGEYALTVIVNGQESTGTITVLQRLISVKLSVSNKEYDGNDNASVTVTPTGILEKDESDVEITIKAEFASAEVGTHDVTLNIYGLSGDRSSNYTLAPYGDKLTGAITPKLSIGINSKVDGTPEFITLYGTSTLPAGTEVIMKDASDKVLEGAGKVNNAGGGWSWKFKNTLPMGVYKVRAVAGGVSSGIQTFEAGGA